MFGAAPRSQAAAFCRSRSESWLPVAATAAVEAMESTSTVAKVIFLIIEVLQSIIPRRSSIWWLVSEYERAPMSPLREPSAILQLVPRSRKILHFLSSILALFALIFAQGAEAQNAAPPVAAEGWYALAPGESALVFMLRSYGGGTVFDVVDGTGRSIDRVTLPERRTILLQYRVSPGGYSVTILGRELKTNARAGLFAAMGFAPTHMPAADGKPASIMPDYAPFAAYTALSMESRIDPLVALGTTDFLPLKKIDATTLDFRVVE
jgi:hypothetical protein